MKNFPIILIFIFTFLGLFKIKDRYKSELQTLEIMKLFRGMKKLVDKTMNVENVQSLEVVEVVLVRCNSLDNQYQ